MRVPCVLLCVCVSAVNAADDYFTKQIAPLLESHCTKCHNTERKEGEFDMTTRAALLHGGESAPGAVPGKPQTSSIIRSVSGKEPEMPEEGRPLNADEVALLRRWVNDGLPWPDGVKLKVPVEKRSDTHFWAWQALKAEGRRRKAEWCKTPIDEFVLEKLDEKKLKPSPEADRTTLIRRLTFDLHGLPPTPEEIDAFVNDRDPQAYEKLVDRLLASPRYGERWGRHWLDVVHYGDTHGYDKDKRRDNAWPYRDYVIRAFNDDKPYSLFIKEQLAGDVLFPDNREARIATGFLAAGPWDWVGHVELDEGTTDKKITQALDRDDVVMNTASTFMSVTVHCARCHDHKFDPIPQKDYYKLQAVFAGIDRGDRPYGESIERLNYRAALDKKKRKLEKRRDELKKLVDKSKPEEIKAIDAKILNVKTELRDLRVQDMAIGSPTNGFHSEISNTPDATKWVQLDLGAAYAIDEIRIVPARPIDFTDTPGFGFPVRFKIEATDDPKLKKWKTIDEHTKSDFENPGEENYSLKPKKLKARFVRITATKLWMRTKDWIFALAEVQVGSGDKNVATSATVTASDTLESGRWNRKHLIDGYSSREKLAIWPPSPEREAAEAAADLKRAELKAKLSGFEAEQKKLTEAWKKNSDWVEFEKITADLKDLEAEVKLLPAPKLVWSPVPRDEPRTIAVLHRGNVEAPGAEVQAGGLSVLKSLTSDFKLKDGADEGQRRAALAEWLTDSKNVLVRRSIVNRIWHYHFGKGIVDSPNDFGYNGGRPTHPELLDWLAEEFARSGESFKKLHKLIVTSAVYRQQSASNPEFEKVDSDNRMLWRMNRRRLDAESLRDSILQISGKLNLNMYGPGYNLFNFKDDHSPHYDYAAFAKVEHPETWRRTIYAFTVRSVPNPLLDCLDCADPNINTPVRNTTNTALQALAVLNDPFVIQQSNYFAERLKPLKTDKERIAAAYKAAIGREPTGDELSALRSYADKHGLANACRMIFNLNEFVFVD